MKYILIALVVIPIIVTVAMSGTNKIVREKQIIEIYDQNKIFPEQNPNETRADIEYEELVKYSGHFVYRMIDNEKGYVCYIYIFPDRQIGNMQCFKIGAK